MRLHYHIKDFVFLVRPRSTDTVSIHAVISSDIYKVDKNIHPGDLVVDIGAHVGSFAIWAASRGARVLAFEPAIASFRLLLENVKLNGYGGERSWAKNNFISAYQLGIASSGGKRTLYIRDPNFGGNSLYVKGGVAEEIITITLKEIFDVHEIKKCDFLKIGCERAEYDILKDFPYFDRVERIASVFVGRSSGDKLSGLLKPKGFQVSSGTAGGIGYLYAERAKDEISI